MVDRSNNVIYGSIIDLPSFNATLINASVMLHQPSLRPMLYYVKVKIVVPEFK